MLVWLCGEVPLTEATKPEGGQTCETWVRMTTSIHRTIRAHLGHFVTSFGSTGDGSPRSPNGSQVERGREHLKEGGSVDVSASAMYVCTWIPSKYLGTHLGAVSVHFLGEKKGEGKEGPLVAPVAPLLGIGDEDQRQTCVMGHP